MANELTYHSAADSGDTLYVQLENTVGQLWNGSAFEAPVSGNWGDYHIAMTEQATSTGIFRASMPAAAAGAYSFIVRKRPAAPAVGNIVRGSSQLFGWDGSVVTSIAAIKSVTDALTVAAASKLALSAAGIVTGIAEAGTLSTTQMTTDLSEATDDHYIGAVLVWTSGVLSGQRTDITDYAGANGLLTFTSITEAPSATDTFVIL